MDEDEIYDDDNDYFEDDDMAKEEKIKVESEEAGLDHMRNWVIDQQKTGGSNFAVLTNEKDGFLVTIYTSNPCTLGHMRPYNKFVNPLQKDTRGTDPKPGDLPFTFPAGDVHAVVFPEHFRAYGNGSPELDELYGWYLGPDSPYAEVLQDDRVEIVKKETGNIPFGFILRKTKEVGPSAFASFISIARELSGYATRLTAINAKYPDKPLADRALASVFVYDAGASGWGSKTGWAMTSPSQYHLNLIGGNLSRFIRGKQYDIDGGLSFFDRAAYNRPNIHWTFGHGRDNSWFFAPFKDTKTPDEFFERLEKLRAEPDDGPFSLKGSDPLIRI